MECAPGESISERDLAFAVFIISSNSESIQRWRSFWADPIDIENEFCQQPGEQCQYRNRMKRNGKIGKLNGGIKRNNNQTGEENQNGSNFQPQIFFITNYSEIASLLPENVGGVLVIQGDSYTALTPQDLKLRVEAGIRQAFLLSYNGFYIDNIFNILPLTTPIKEISPLLFFQVASNSQGIEGRSFWVRRSYFFDAISFQLPGNCQGFFLEAQFYPSLIVNKTARPPPIIPSLWPLFIIGLLLLITIIFWLYCLIW